VRGYVTVTQAAERYGRSPRAMRRLHDALAQRNPRLMVQPRGLRGGKRWVNAGALARLMPAPHAEEAWACPLCGRGEDTHEDSCLYKLLDD